MTTLTCRFGAARPVQWPLWLAQGNAVAVVDAFRIATGGELNVRIQKSTERLIAGEGEVGSYDLHAALRRLVGPPSNPINTVGVVLAGRYRYGGILGIMFDTAFDLDVPGEGSVPSLAGPPREGCAIFLDEIAARRQPGFENDAQSCFTTIHELGHVFNLVHDNVNSCFMCESAYSTTYSRDYWRFTPAQSLWLRNARPAAPAAWPGGSPFREFDNGDGRHEPGRRGIVPITLHVGIARERFHAFEPVELDVEARLAPGRKRPVDIPDVLDPGYDAFRVWIADPSGERRRLRSPRLYCASGALRRVAADAPFLRDISVFGESGGFTFRRAGAHRVWVELELPGGSICRSNDVAIEILPIRTQRAADDARLFSTAAVRAVLYHRLDRHRGRGVRLLDEWLGRCRGHHAAPTVRYAIARALHERGAKTHRRLTAAETRKIRRLLSRASDSDTLGESQRRKARSVVDRNELDH